MIITSGGLGPTADDLTAEVVAEFAGPRAAPRRGAGGPDRRDPRAAARALARRDRRGRAARGQPQAGDGARGRDGARAGRDRARARRARRTARRCVVLPGPPGELQPMWRAALETEALQAALAGAGVYEQRILRLFGPPESEIAKTLREAERDGVPLERLEITTCLRRGEIEIATVFEPDGRRRLRRVRGGRARAPRRDGVRARRRDDRRAGGGRAARPARAHRRGRGVVHRRPDGGPADRPRRLLRLRARRADRVLERGEGGAGGRRRRR